MHRVCSCCVTMCHGAFQFTGSGKCCQTPPVWRRFIQW